MLLLVALPKKPEPKDIKPPAAATQPAGHRLLCEELGIETPLTENEVLGFMASTGLKTLDRNEVNDYMDALAIRARSNWGWCRLRKEDHETASADGYELRSRLWWIRACVIVPLWIMAAGTLFFFGSQGGHPEALFLAILGCLFGGGVTLGPWPIFYSRHVGFTSPTVYEKPVPIEHLRHAQALSQRFPKLHFFVADYDVAEPDPFIMCTTHKGWRIVFGVWDAPGFGGGA